MLAAARSRPALWLAILAGIGILIALATAAPPAVTYRSNVTTDGAVRVPRAADRCVPLVVVPAETRAIRLGRVANQPVPAAARLVLASGTALPLSGPTLVDSGTRAVYRLPRTIGDTTLGGEVCLRANAPNTAVAGSGTTPAVDLLGARRSSWLEAVPLLGQRAAFARAVVGGWALPLALLCVIAAWVLVVRLAPRSRDTVVDRRAIGGVMAVAALMGTAFTITTPALQAPDEMVHLHYVDLLRDRQTVPTSIQAGPLSPQLDALIAGSKVSEVAFQPSHRPPWTPEESAAFDRQLDAVPSGGAIDTFTNASSQPPGYYGAAAVLTRLTGGDELRRLLVVRLFSVLLMAFAVAGTVVFARAAVPTAGGLILVGGLMVATTPVVAFIGGSVNPDSAYAAAAAWTLAGLATILRSGLTMRRALWVGAATGAGLASKLTFIPMVAVVLAAALVVLIREIRCGRLRAAIAPMAASVATAGIIGAPFLLWAQFGGRGLVFGPPGGPVGQNPSKRELVSYAIELFVGQVGPIKDRIAGSGPHIFIDGLAGRLGWLDYSLPATWVTVLQWLWTVLLVLAFVGVARALLRRRASWLEFGLWSVAVGALVLAIAQAGFQNRSAGATGFEQARYLLPLASIAVAGIALAVRQLPARVHGWIAGLLCVAGVLHGTVLWFMTIGRYFA